MPSGNPSSTHKSRGLYLTTAPVVCFCICCEPCLHYSLLPCMRSSEAVNRVFSARTRFVTVEREDVHCKCDMARLHII
ncbi:hypothetical protein OE88DRAFT_250447 [Heliocybe sulcata]|uniref:Uncharacterized protein n=1 Tax=Heliocybe sulcata TaxID=5364 RepID=A0A5C3MZT6_9AGAM|nr:hypothetical protein OE88DRAFT_250447 [Heliocybe sulcata]